MFNPLNPSVALIETSQLICCANHFTGFYMRATLPFNGLNILRSGLSRIEKDMVEGFNTIRIRVFIRIYVLVQ